MSLISRRDFVASLLVLPATLQAKDDNDWIPLFDGHSLKGWKAGQNRHSFRVVDGKIAAGGPPSHLYYSGRVSNANFKNFELLAEVMPRPGSQSGIYFHTGFERQGAPRQGFKVEINNTYAGQGDYLERRKTGSLYGVRNVFKAFAQDNEWSQLRLRVRGKQVCVWLNEVMLVDYLEPDPPLVEPDYPGRVLGRGTLALESAGPGSTVFFRNLRLKPLADNLLAEAAPPPLVDNTYKDLMWMNAQNFPVLDCHVHLKGGLTIEEALRESRRLGIQYGVAINGGLGFPTTTDAAAQAYLDSMRGQPVFLGLQGEGREWVTLFSRQTVAKFDYVFTDAMTFTDDQGKRMRIWIKDEVGEIKDEQRFMDMLVDRITRILDHEPIDIHANPTVLPDVLAAEYDRLWTPERMEIVIDAAKRNDVAIEINNRYRVPSPAFIKAGKRAGLKFSFGTNNGDKNLGRDEYGVAMVKECGLTWKDMFVPKPEGEKAIQRRDFPKL